MGEGKPKHFHLLAGSKDCWNNLGWLFCILSLHRCIRSAEEMMLSKVLSVTMLALKIMGSRKKVSRAGDCYKYQLPSTTVFRTILHSLLRYLRAFCLTHPCSWALCLATEIPGCV